MALQQLSAGQTYPEITINENSEAVDHTAVYAKDATSTSALTWGYIGGRWGGFAITAATLSLTANLTNYIVVAKATGVISVSTSNTNWNDGTNYARVYKVVAGASSVSSSEDHRSGPSGVHGGGSGGVGTGASASGLEYTASSTTTDSDPGTGVLRWNNATQASATILYIDNAEADGASVATLWAALRTDTILKVTKADDPDTWQIWKVTATPVNGTGYYKFTVSLLGQEGSNIGNGVSILLDVDSAGASAFVGGTLTTALNEAPTVTIASSTTPAIFAAAANTINMTGTTTVTGFDTIAAGARRTVIFAAVLQLTHNGTSMQNVTAANITTAAGDAAAFLSLGSGNTKMLWYQRKNGTPLAGNSNALGRGVAVGDYGTLANDGSTDDAAVFAAALASGAKYINARGLNVAILTMVSLVAGVVLDISGSTITTTGSTITTFKADTIDDFALIADGATIVGAGSTTGSAKAVHIVGCNRYLIRGLRAKNIKGHGFYVAPGTPSGSARGDQGVIDNCLSEACYWGWEDTPGTGAEYTIVRGFRTSGCTTWGVKTSAGNILWEGGQDVDNVGDGFVMVAGSNHAHGTVTGRNINHNGTNNLSCTGIVNGESFVGCHLYEKIILLDGCKGITFTGGVIDAPTITVNSGSGSGKCRMQGVFFPGDYAAPPAIGGTDTRSLTLKDCFGPGNPGNTDLVTVDKSADYTYGIDDESITHLGSDTTARTFTIPANSSVPYPIGKTLSGVNQHLAGNVTLAITSDTMRWAGAGSTGSRTIAADGTWAAKKIAATEWLVTGVNMT